MARFKFVIPVTVTINLVEPGEVDSETGEMAFADRAAQERGAWDWAEAQRDQIVDDIMGVEDWVDLDVGDPEIVVGEVKL